MEHKIIFLVFILLLSISLVAQDYSPGSEMGDAGPNGGCESGGENIVFFPNLLYGGLDRNVIFRRILKYVFWWGGGYFNHFNNLAV